MKIEHQVASKYTYLKFQYKGYLGEKNKAPYKADSHLYQCTFGIVHFHYCLN